MSKVFSNEDGNLSESIRVVREREYSDVDLSLSARTSEFGYTDDDGDILKKRDANAVKQSLKNLLLTNRFEKPYRPQYGADLGGLLFELMDGNTGNEMIARIKSAINRYEPRAKVLDLKVVASPDYNSVSVIIEFRVVQTGFIDTLRVGLTESAPASVAFVPPTTITPEPDLILLAENGNRLVTLQGLLLQVELDTFGILTQAEVSLLTQDGLTLEEQ
jgi:phage baseplate assembly protein W